MNNTEQLTEAALNSLNNIKQVEANDFLYPKIMNRMLMNEQRERITYNRLMIKLSMALAIFICLNGISFYVFKQQQGKGNNKTTLSGSAALADEYSLKGNSYSY